MSRSPLVTLTRHFIGLLAAPPLLSDLGVDFLRRTAASLLAILLVAGIFITRAMFERYIDLHAAFDAAAYARAVQADSLLMIALPMLVVGLTATVMAPMLFPDETDYRTLSPLPISRFQIFAAKLVAVFVVTATAILAINAVTSFWFPIASDPSWTRMGRRWMPYPLPSRIAAHGVATLAGSVWIFSAVMASQGVCLAFMPDRWRRRAGLVVQTVLLIGLILSIPYLIRIPSMDVGPDAVSRAPLGWFPAVWFLGLEHWLLSHSADGYAEVAEIALIAMLLTSALIVVCYTWLFRTAETLAADASPIRRTRAPVVPAAPVGLTNVPQATLAVLSFTWNGLLRSRLHQVVFVLIASTGAALVVGQLLTAFDASSLPAWRSQAHVHAALAAPLLLALSLALALRTTLLLPADPGASWVFRLTESDATRPLALNAAALIFTMVALVPALVLAVVIQPSVLGVGWLSSTLLTTLAILLLVEILLRNWCRIPYTCTFLPGKRILAYTLGVLFVAYAAFVYLNAQLMRWTLLVPWRAALYGGVLLAVVAALRRSRRRTWGRQALEFEDEDPLVIRRLHLSPDEHH